VTAAELLASLHHRGFTLAVGDGDTLTLSPKAQVTPELRELVRTHKQELITLLRPQSFDNPRSKVRQLEKALNVNSPEPEGFVLWVIFPDHPHSTAEMAAAQRRLAAQWAATSDGFHLDTRFVGCDGCHVCRLLGTEPPLPGTAPPS